MIEASTWIILMFVIFRNVFVFIGDDGNCCVDVYVGLVFPFLLLLLLYFVLSCPSEEV